MAYSSDVEDLKCHFQQLDQLSAPFNLLASSPITYSYPNHFGEMVLEEADIPASDEESLISQVPGPGGEIEMYQELEAASLFLDAPVGKCYLFRENRDSLYDMNPALFRDRYGMYQTSFKDLMDKVGPVLWHHFPGSINNQMISPEKRVAIAIRYFHASGTLKAVASNEFHRVSHVTVYNCIVQVTKVLSDLKEEV